MLLSFLAVKEIWFWMSVCLSPIKPVTCWSISVNLELFGDWGTGGRAQLVAPPPALSPFTQIGIDIVYCMPQNIHWARVWDQLALCIYLVLLTCFRLWLKFIPNESFDRLINAEQRWSKWYKCSSDTTVQTSIPCCIPMNWKPKWQGLSGKKILHWGLEAKASCTSWLWPRSSNFHPNNTILC